MLYADFNVNFLTTDIITDIISVYCEILNIFIMKLLFKVKKLLM